MTITPEAEAAEKRERDYRKNEEIQHQKVFAYMLDAIREEAKAKHRSPVEILSATRQSEIQAQHKADEKLLRKHGIVID